MTLARGFALIGLVVVPCTTVAPQTRENSAIAAGSIDSVLQGLHHPAAAVVQDVRTGRIVALSSAGLSSMGGAPLRPTTPIRPLSAMKVYLAAMWWDRAGADENFRCGKTSETVEDILVYGCDGSGKALALELRRRLGATAMLKELAKFGFNPGDGARRISAPNDSDGVELTDMAFARPTITLPATADDSTWARALSVGEMDLSTTLIDLSRFWQAIGNEGVRVESTSSSRSNSRRLISAQTARRLQHALLRGVAEGTAKSVAGALSATGWMLGGKTGTGPGVDRRGSGGLFAGLLLDATKRARYTIVVLVEGAGPGGTVAASTAADIAKLVSEGDSRRMR